MSDSTRTMDTSALGGSDDGGRRRIDRWMEIAAVIMLPLGAALIILGWVGASRTPYVFEQIPYLISGGILGAGLMIAGGLIYVGSWVARSAAGIGGSTDIQAIMRAASGTVAPSNGHGATAGGFVATPSGTMFHRADCAVVAGRTDVRSVNAKAQEEMVPCGMCAPLTV